METRLSHRLTETGWKWLPAGVIRRLFHSRLRFSPLDVAGTVFKLAETRDEREQALTLVHDMYVRRGILSPLSRGLRVPPHTLLPTTAVFIALRHGRVVGTVSLIEDSALGLPMEDVHPDEVRRLRRQGARLAEVGALAVGSEERGKGLALMLYTLMFRWARWYRRIGVLSAAVHARVLPLYQGLLMFERLGPTRFYSSLNDAVSVPLGLDLPHALARLQTLDARGAVPFSAGKATRNLHAFFCTRHFDGLHLPRRPRAEHELPLPPGWSVEDLFYFLARSAEAGGSLSFAQRWALQLHHPELRLLPPDLAHLPAEGNPPCSSTLN